MYLLLLISFWRSMRVAATYYKSGFRWPVTVERVVNEMNKITLATHDHIAVNMAKRIKSLCLKHYKEGSKHNIQFCDEWAKCPCKFLDYVLVRFPDGRCRISRKDRLGDFEPSNIELKPIN